jgi:septin family protein
VVGEAGLGKTTLLESFFKSFRDEDATSALFERKETQKVSQAAPGAPPRTMATRRGAFACGCTASRPAPCRGAQVIETRRLLEDAGTRRDAVEREMRAAAETGKYVTARKRQAEINSLAREAMRLAEELKVLRAADERRRVELHTLRESARSLRMEMKRAADSFDFQLASEKQVEARAVQAECEALQAALREMRRDPTTGKTGGDDEEEASSASKSGLTSATVRVSPFDPFGITVGKNELMVTLIDTPGYGDNLNTVESFEVITAHVEGLFKAQLLAETSASTRDYDRLRNEDPLVHCCLYFIAPHRLKHIDVAFMRRLHQWVNIVPIIAKSDTMTTKEKEEFKLQVRETLAREGIEPYAFDPASVRSMEQQDRQEYKPPWAVIGSTDAHLDAGVNVYLRKYPWGDALSSEPSHSDLPALRNLIMWSGQWQELKQSSRVKYEQWRVSRSVASRSSFAVSSLAAAAGAGLGRQIKRANRAGAATCHAAGLAPRTALRLLGLMLLLLAPLPAVAAYRWAVSVDPSASRQAELMRGLVDQMAAEKGAAAQAYEKRLAALSGQLKAAQAAGETTAMMERLVHKEREALARSLQAAKDRISTLQSEAMRAASEKAAAEEKAAAALVAARSAASAAHGGRCWNDVASDNMRSLLDSTAKASGTLFDAANDAAKEVRRKGRLV